MARTPRDPDRDHQRRKGHRYNDSTSELLPHPPRQHRRRDSESASPEKKRRKKKRYYYPEETSESSKSTSNALSAGALSHLDQLNVGNVGWNSNGGIKGTERQRVYEDEEEERRRRERRERRERRRRERGERGEDLGSSGERRKRRIVSGTHLERGAEPYDEKVVLVNQRTKMRGGAGSVEYEEEETARKRKRRKRIGEWICETY